MRLERERRGLVSQKSVVADSVAFLRRSLTMAGRGQLPLPEQLNRVVEAVKQLFERRAENLKFVEVNGCVQLY